MATPVHEITSMDRALLERKEDVVMDMSASTQHVAPNRALAPAVLLAFLILCFLVSPYLPTGLREYISALVR